jgi:hypothetical protein
MKKNVFTTESGLTVTLNNWYQIECANGLVDAELIEISKDGLRFRDNALQTYCIPFNLDSEVHSANPVFIQSLEELATYISDNTESGDEIIVNDSLHFGCGLYAYSSDKFIFTGVETEEGKNPVFLHIKNTYNNILAALKNLVCRDGYLDVNTLNITLCL